MHYLSKDKNDFLLHFFSSGLSLGALALLVARQDSFDWIYRTSNATFAVQQVHQLIQVRLASWYGKRRPEEDQVQTGNVGI